MKKSITINLIDSRVHFRLYNPISIWFCKNTLLRSTDRKLNIVGGDVNPKAVELANLHAKLAGVDGYVKFNLRKAQDFVTKQSYGVNISNPPYGERIGDEQEVRQLSKDMGALYKKLDKWNFYFLSPNQDFERDFGRRADKKRFIYNAGIKCSFYSFNGPKPKK